MGHGATVEGFHGGYTQAATDRRALLILPDKHEANHKINTETGSVHMKELTAKTVKVGSGAGRIALHGTQAKKVRVKTGSGAIELHDMVLTDPAKVESESGDIHVHYGSAPAWSLRTESGNVTVKGAQGQVKASSETGTTDVNQPPAEMWPKADPDEAQPL